MIVLDERTFHAHSQICILTDYRGACRRVEQKTRVFCGRYLTVSFLGLPIVGYAPFLGNFPWKVMWKLREKYGGIMSLYMGKDLAIILQDYESIRAAFIGQEDTFLGRGKSFVMQKLATGKDGQIHGNFGSLASCVTGACCELVQINVYR